MHLRIPNIPLIFILAVPSILAAQTSRPHAAALQQFSDAVEELVSSVSPAVVQIEVRSRAAVDSATSGQTGYFAKQSASGSGVIVDPSGYIITNAHVAESKNINVSVADTSDPTKKDAHKHYPAVIVGIDKETDLAVLKIEATNLPVLTFLDSDTLKQGQIVFALGSPIGAGQPPRIRIRECHRAAAETGPADDLYPDRCPHQSRQQRRPSARYEWKSGRHQHDDLLAIGRQ